MRISCKKMWLAVVVTALAVSVWVCWAVMTHGPVQVITLPDGRQYRFAGASWGTNHSQPRLLAHVVDHLPDKWADYVRTKLGPRVGLRAPVREVSPRLLVWFEQTGTNSVSASTSRAVWSSKVALADGTGVRGGTRGGPAYAKDPWVAFEFTEVPRRSRMLDCQVMLFDQNSGARLSLEHVKFPNPLFGHFLQWQPDTLPVQKTDGHLRVQLTSFVTRPVSDGNWSRETVFSLALQPTRTNEKWRIDGLELSDATGNRLRQVNPNWVAEGTNAFPLTLWPDEAALRLSLTLKRVSGFTATELVRFTNLPVLKTGLGATSGTSLTNLMMGIPLVVENFGGPVYVHGTVVPGPYWVNVKLPDDPPAMAVDIVEMVTDTGEKLSYSGLWRSTPRSSMWNFQSLPDGAKFVNVTVAVQKERFVEFVAKPVEEK